MLSEVGSYNPAAHAVQDTTAEIAEYWPRGHMLHKVAPALTPVSVTEPAGHTVQLVALTLAANRPAGHKLQANP